MSLKRQVAVNVVSNWVGFLVQAAAGIVIIPFVLRQVGTEAYGVWALLAGLLAYFQILESAFSLSINRFAAYYRSDMASVNRYFTATVHMTLTMGVVVVLLGAGISLVVDKVFSIPAALETQARVTCILVVANLAVVAINSAMVGLLNGFQLYAASNVTKIVDSAGRVGLVFWVLASTPTIVALQACYCVSSLLSLVVTVVAVAFSLSGVRCFVSTNWLVHREILQYMKHSLIRSGSDLFMYATLLPLVGFFGTMRDAAVFSLASKVPQVVRGLLASAQSVFLPAFSTLFAREGADGIVRIVRTSTRLNATLTFAVVTLSIAYTEPMLRVWLGAEYDPAIVVPMILLLLAVVPRGVFELWMPGLVAMGDLTWLSIMAMVTCVSTILLAAVLSVVLVPTMAPAVALLIGMTLRSGLWLPAYGAAKTGLILSSYLRTTLLRPILATALFIGILIVTFVTVPAPADLVPFVLHGGLSAILVAFVAGIVVMPEVAVRYTKVLVAMVRR